MTTAAYNPAGDFNVRAGEILTALDQGGVWMSQLGLNPPHNLTLDGTLDVKTTDAFPNYDVAGVTGSGTFSGATFTISATGVLSVSVASNKPMLATYGFNSSWSADITNAGRIAIVTDGFAIGIQAPMSNIAGKVINSGVLTVSSNSEFASAGVVMELGGTFRNSGTIEVHSHSMARGVRIGSFGGDLHNSGTIAVTDESSAFASVAVDWLSSAYPGQTGSFVNNGVLKGDIALLATAQGNINPAAVEVFTNNGTMIGAVDLGAAPSMLINNGLISGDITLGGSNDAFDGQAGTVSGSISGGDGDDSIIGGANADIIAGGAGDDVIDGGGGANQLDGGAGVNTLSFKSSGVAATVDMAAGSARTTETETFVNFQRLAGSDRADTLAGSAGADTIAAGVGDDLVYATAGQDQLSGDAGYDTLSFERATSGVEVRFANGAATGLSSVAGFEEAIGSSYSDTLAGGAGVRTIYGAGGADSILGSDGANYLRGDDGNDTILGASAYDNVNGNKGDDSIDGGSGGSDWLLGGQGNDVIVAHAGENILNGNMGQDTITGGVGSETIRGGQGDDSISAGDGNDWLAGDRGDDVLRGGKGADSFYFFSGAGVDRVLDFNVSEGDRVLLDAGTHYTVYQTGADTIIDLDGGDRLMLVGAPENTLVRAWIFEI